MDDTQFRRWRWCLTALAMLGELAQLTWQRLHGGVVSHHLLDQPALPAVSNAWGALLLPGLVWFLGERIRQRLDRGRGQGSGMRGAGVAAGFLIALLFGAGIALSFSHGNDAATNGLFEAMIVLALLLPGYRAECVLGFVLGMALTFGAVLPTAVAVVIAGASALVHRGLWPLLVWLARSVRQRPVS